MVSNETLETVLVFITIIWFASGMFLALFTGLSILTTGDVDLANIIGFVFGIVCTTIALWALNAQRRCQGFDRN